MVKSKKMSKTGIAVIVLAILLVLSMVMGMTGAWYSATSNADGAGSGSFKLRDRWISLSLSSADGVIEAYRSDKTTKVTDPDGLMPGDYIKADSSVLTLTVTLEGSDTDYSSVGAYVFLVNSSNQYVQYADMSGANAFSSSNNSLVFSAIEIGVTGVTLESKDSLGAKADGYYQVNTGLTEASMGQIVANFSIGDYTVKAIQKENIADISAAATQLGITAAAGAVNKTPSGN